MSTANENPLSTITNKSKHQWHCYWVFEDPAFLKSVKEIKQYLDNATKLKYSTGSEKLKRNKLINEAFDRKRELCEFYKITNLDLGSYWHKDTFPNIWPQNPKFEQMEYTYEKDKIYIEVQKSITYEDFVSIWKHLVEFRSSDPIITTKKRNRIPDDTRLIYAIFIARKKYTFPEIFKLYQDGELNNYAGGPTNQFSSSKSLEVYYRKYSPH